MHVQRTSILILSTFVAGALGWLLSPIVRSAGALSERQPSATEQSSCTTPIGGDAAIAALSNTTSVTCEEYLRAYFGARWGEMQQLLEKTTYDPKTPVIPNAIPSWSSVEQEFEMDLTSLENEGPTFLAKALAWDGGQTTDNVDFSTELYNPDRVKLDVFRIQALRKVAKSYDDQLLSLAETSNVVLEEGMHALWKQGHYQRAPIVMLKPGNKNKRKMHLMRYVAKENWAVSMAVYAGDLPAFDELLAQIDQLKEQRTAAVTKLIGRG